MVTRMPDVAHDCPVCSTAMVDHFKTEEADYTLCPNCDYLRAWAKDVNPPDLNISLYNERFDQHLEETRVMDDKRRRKYRRFLGQVAKVVARGERITVWGVKNQVANGTVGAACSSVGVERTEHRLNSG